MSETTSLRSPKNELSSKNSNVRLSVSIQAWSVSVNNLETVPEEVLIFKISTLF